MSKKMKIILSILVPVLILAVGGASLAFADEASSSGNATDNVTPLKGLLPRVAAILGIPEQTLSDAYKQAEKQIKEEQIFKTLERAVASGRMTQEEADKLKEWYLSKPESANLGKAPIARIFGKIRAHFKGPRGPIPPPAITDNLTGSSNVIAIQGLLPRVAAILGISVEELQEAIRQAEQGIRSESLLQMVDKAVEKGLITQEEGDQIKQWWQQRPEAANRLLQQFFQKDKQHQTRPNIKSGPRGLDEGHMPGKANPQGLLRGAAPGGTW